eukprot:6229149-Pyramimonas_sp.AAC.1
MAAIEAKMDAKFQNMQDQLSTLSRSPSTAASSASGGSRKRPAMRPLPELLPDPLQPNEKDQRNPCRNWIVGWPRK